MSKINPAQLVSFLHSRYYLQESQSFMKHILKLYPEFSFKNYAYRAIIIRPDERLSYHRQFFEYNSWSHNFSGILAFLDNCHEEMNEDFKVHIFESHIEGLDLTKIIDYLRDQGIPLAEEIIQIYKEREVICLTYQELNPVNNNFLYEDKIVNLLDNLQSQVQMLFINQSISPSDLMDIKGSLDQALFFVSSLGLEDKWGLKATLDYLDSLNDSQPSKAVRIRLYDLGFFNIID